MVNLTEISIKSDSINSEELKNLLYSIGLHCPLDTTIFFNDSLVAQVALNEKNNRAITMFDHNIADHD